MRIRAAPRLPLVEGACARKFNTLGAALRGPLVETLALDDTPTPADFSRASEIPTDAGLKEPVVPPRQRGNGELDGLTRESVETAVASAPGAASVRVWEMTVTGAAGPREAPQRVNVAYAHFDFLNIWQRASRIVEEVALRDSPAMIAPHASDLAQRGWRPRSDPGPAPRRGCGRPYPIRCYRYETLRQIGWPLFRVARLINWCGHGQELIPVLDEGECVRLVPVISK